MSKAEDIHELMEAFYAPGSLTGGGVTRLGYSEAEDELHRIFFSIGEQLGLRSYSDEVGNSFLSNPAADRAEEAGRPWHLVGSHLDSVVCGGRFDGVAGVVAGLACLKWLQEEGRELPLRVGAFRCEESAAFGRSTVGSGLITGEVKGEALADFKNREGRSLQEVFAGRGYSLQPQKIAGLADYLELHIEQGKVLESRGLPLGIVQAIAAPRRFRAKLAGQADHSGATPMNLRADALCAAAELILAAEKIGRAESAWGSVATVGILQNSPNVMNVIPGCVELGIDSRGIDLDSLDRMEAGLREAAGEIARRRGVEIVLEKRSEDRPAQLDEQVQEGLREAARVLGLSFLNMPSGAGHDALGFSKICPTGMVFIPCRGGISHSREEFTAEDAILKGAEVILQYLKTC